MLKRILQKYFGLKDNYDDDEWNNAYEKLIRLVYDLIDLGVINENDRVDDKLDAIERGKW